MKPPDNSYDRFDTLEEYVDSFFAKRGKLYTYARDVQPLFHKKMSWAAKGLVVDISANTFKKWQIRYNNEHNA